MSEPLNRHYGLRSVRQCVALDGQSDKEFRYEFCEKHFFSPNWRDGPLSGAYLALTACWHSSDHHDRYCLLLLGIDASAARWTREVKWCTASWTHWKKFQTSCSSYHLFTPMAGMPFTSKKYRKVVASIYLLWPAKWSPSVHKLNQLTGQYWRISQFEFGNVRVCLLSI